MLSPRLAPDDLRHHRLTDPELGGERALRFSSGGAATDGINLIPHQLGRMVVRTSFADTGHVGAYSVRQPGPCLASDRVAHRGTGYPELGGQCSLSLSNGVPPATLRNDFRRQLGLPLTFPPVARSVAHPVLLVLGGRGPVHVLRPAVVQRAAGSVATFMARWSRLGERFKHQVVHQPCLSSRFIIPVVESHREFAGTQTRRQQVTAQPWFIASQQTAHVASVTDFIQPFIAEYRLPHLHDRRV